MKYDYENIIKEFRYRLEWIEGHKNEKDTTWELWKLYRSINEVKEFKKELQSLEEKNNINELFLTDWVYRKYKKPISEFLTIMSKFKEIDFQGKARDYYVIINKKEAYTLSEQAFFIKYFLEYLDIKNKKLLPLIESGKAVKNEIDEYKKTNDLISYNSWVQAGECLKNIEVWCDLQMADVAENHDIAFERHFARYGDYKPAKKSKYKRIYTFLAPEYCVYVLLNYLYDCLVLNISEPNVVNSYIQRFYTPSLDLVYKDNLLLIKDIGRVYFNPKKSPLRGSLDERTYHTGVFLELLVKSKSVSTKDFKKQLPDYNRALSDIAIPINQRLTNAYKNGDINTPVVLDKADTSEYGNATYELKVLQTN